MNPPAPQISLRGMVGVIVSDVKKLGCFYEKGEPKVPFVPKIFKIIPVWLVSSWWAFRNTVWRRQMKICKRIKVQYPLPIIFV